jgi:hypothetical protein
MRPIAGAGAYEGAREKHPREWRAALSLSSRDLMIYTPLRRPGKPTLIKAMALLESFIGRMVQQLADACHPRTCDSFCLQRLITFALSSVAQARRYLIYGKLELRRFLRFSPKVTTILFRIIRSDQNSATITSSYYYVSKLAKYWH